MGANINVRADSEDTFSRERLRGLNGGKPNSSKLDIRG